MDRQQRLAKRRVLLKQAAAGAGALYDLIAESVIALKSSLDLTSYNFQTLNHVIRNKINTLLEMYNVVDNKIAKEISLVTFLLLTEEIDAGDWKHAVLGWISVAASHPDFGVAESPDWHGEMPLPEDAYS